jgi:D-lactate dehydrogenase
MKEAGRQRPASFASTVARQRQAEGNVKVAVFSTKQYDRRFLEPMGEQQGHELVFLEPRLSRETAPLAAGFGGVCAFVHDILDRPVLEALHSGGVRLIALRSAGFNNVDLAAAAELGLTVCRVPAYSPHAVAEHAAGMILSLNRRLHRAYARVRDGNFLLDGLLGFDLNGRCVGIVGTGRIGTVFARIMAGFGCRLMATDPHPNDECRSLGVKYVDHDELFAESDIIALHTPLTPETHHLIDADALARMKRGVMLINTSRGALVDTAAVVEALKSGQVGYLALDVYEEEADLFFTDLSGEVIQDDVFARLLTFPNVLITAHQAFFTEEALERIAETTMANVTAFEREGRPVHEVSAKLVA